VIAKTKRMHLCSRDCSRRSTGCRDGGLRITHEQQIICRRNDRAPNYGFGSLASIAEKHVDFDGRSLKHSRSSTLWRGAHCSPRCRFTVCIDGYAGLCLLDALGQNLPTIESIRTLRCAAGTLVVCRFASGRGGLSPRRLLSPAITMFLNVTAHGLRLACS
jgi:hypothetical protein